MDPTELVNWEIAAALLGGISLLVAAFRVKLNIKLDVNDIVDQIITYRREDKLIRFQNKCPHVYPVEAKSWGRRPEFKSAKMIADDGSFVCSMCDMTGYITEDIDADIEAFWSTRTRKDWGEKMERRNRVAGLKRN